MALKGDKTTADNSPIIKGNYNTVIIDGEINNSTTDIIASNVLVFDGSDTLAVSNAISLIDKLSVSKDDLVMVIAGFDNLESVDSVKHSFSGSARIDGYIRSLLFECAESGLLLDVGGDNATLERIAATKIELYIGKGLYNELGNSFINFHDSELKKTLNNNDLGRSLKFNQIIHSITIAKGLKNGASLDVMFKMLERNLVPSDMAFLTEGFRVFSVYTKNNERAAISCISKLSRFINDNLNNKDYSEAIVYAIESIGYLAKSNFLTSKIASSFIAKLLKNDDFIFAHRDILWASLVALKGLVHSNKINSNIQNILLNLDSEIDNYSVIIQCGNELLYRK
jgi:hypothetical protein